MDSMKPYRHGQLLYSYTGCSVVLLHFVPRTPIAPCVQSSAINRNTQAVSYYEDHDGYGVEFLVEARRSVRLALHYLACSVS